MGYITYFGLAGIAVVLYVLFRLLRPVLERIWAYIS